MSDREEKVKKIINNLTSKQINDEILAWTKKITEPSKGVVKAVAAMLGKNTQTNPKFCGDIVYCLR